MTDKLCPLMVIKKRTKPSSSGQTIEDYRYSKCIEDRCTLWKPEVQAKDKHGEIIVISEGRCGLVR